MKKLLLILLFLSPLTAQSACRIDGDGKKSETITLNVTFDLSNKLLSLSQNQILAFTKNFSCATPWDKMYFTDNIGDNIYSLSGLNNVRFSIKGTSTNFPVPVVWGDNKSSVINKVITLQFKYVKNGSESVKFFENNTFTIDKAFTVASQKCWETGGACIIGSDASQFNVNLKVTVINKRTTCEFSSPTYEIKMDDITVQQLITGNVGVMKSTNVELKCDGIYNISSNPVTVKLSEGDWNTDETKLVSSIVNGAKNVGFNIYEVYDGGMRKLNKGSKLLSILKNSTINDRYNVPIAAEYTLINHNERPTSGLVSSKVILKIEYQ